MSLRTRMAAVAGVAVALTVVVLAAAQYEAARSTLRGQIDSALRDRAAPIVSNPPLRGQGDQGGQGGGPGDGDDHGRVPPNPFGDAAGKVQYLSPQGTIVSSTTTSSQLPVDARAKALAASGVGSYFSDAHVSDVHLRVLTVGLGRNGAAQIARPLTEVDHALNQLLLVVLAVGGVGILLAAALGGRGGTRGACSDLALHPPHRGADGQS